MSFNSWAQICFGRKGGSNLDAIQVLLSEGWSLGNALGGLPAHQEDSDGYPEWLEASLDDAQTLFSRFDQLDASGKYFSVEISWEHTDTVVSVGFNAKIGGNFDMSIGIVSGRRMISGYYDLTDHSWYMERLVMPLLDRDWSIRNLDWQDSA